MPNGKLAKTASALKLNRSLNQKVKAFRKNLEVIVAGLLILSVLLFGALIEATRLPKETLAMGGMVFRAEVVETPALLEKGLSGRPGLAPDAAMVFVFDTSNTWCFWMKDMNFSIDILWLDDNKIIRHIESELSPTTYPQQYCPPTPARYVVEVRAGTTGQLGLKLGDQVSFQIH